MKLFLTICLIVILLVIVVVGIIGLAQNKIVEENRNALTSDMQELAKSALEYYRSPLYLGGGNFNWIPKVDDEYQTKRLSLWLNHAGFANYTSDDTFKTPNGIIEMWVNSYNDDNLKLAGSGLETGKDKINPVKVLLTINGPTEGITIKILN